MDYNVKILFDRLHKASATKEGIVEIEYYSKNMRRRYRTGVKVYPSQWKDGMVCNRLDAPVLNSKIHDKYRWVVECAEQGEAALDQLATAPSQNFVEWLLDRVLKRTDITESTRKQHLVMVRAVEDSGLFKTFRDLTAANLQRFDDFIRPRTHCQASVYNYHKRLKVYMNTAVMLDLIKDNPYKKFKASRGQGGNRQYLTEAERRMVENIHLTGYTAIARDMFILSCYTGLSYSDLIKIDREHTMSDRSGNLYLEDRRRKTGSNYRLKLLPPVVKILDRYDWNMNRMCNQSCNRELKLIAVMCGIRKNVTMHVGRHTFATWALSRGVSIEIVSKMLAHADITTTQIYAKVLQESVDEGFDKLL